MQIICEGLDLGAATLKVTKAIASKTTNPILEGIKLTAQDGKLILSATDLEIGIEKTIKAQVKQEGETVVPGKFFSEFIKKLSNEQIKLTVNEKNNLLINYTDSESSLQCFNPLEFPTLNKIEDGEYFKISQNNFKNLINKSVFAVAVDDSRPILKGVLLEIGDGFVKAVALDGYRMAVVKKPISKTTAKTSIIVPSRSLNEISKILDDSDDEIEVYIQKNFLMVDLKDTKITTRLIDGDFMNYSQLIPKDFATSITINKLQLEDALDRTSVLSRIDRNNLVMFNIKEKVLVLTSNSEIGTVKENLSISLKGNDLAIAFNARYFTESLRAIGEEFIKISFNMQSSPCVITPPQGEEYLYLVLPVRMINQ